MKNVAFHLQEGETLGIVGKTGSGKSAILKLLLRQFDQYEGNISYGGIPIEDYEKEQLRKAIGYVPQDHFLFSASVYDNIAFSDEHAEPNVVEQAARTAHIHEDILRFTQGYETVVGERALPCREAKSSVFPSHGHS